MDVVAGVGALRREHGPAFAVIGVFDGLHRGHAYLLEHLVSEARRRDARATVITFDHHPDEVLTGTAPPLLIDADERLERLAAAGVEVTVVQHFDDAVRRTTYDAFVEQIRIGAGLAGLLMTPDAAFGFERRGTPDTLAALGQALDFDVVVIPPFSLAGRSVRSADIRAAIAEGDLGAARELLGRPITYRGTGTGNGAPVDLRAPMAMPPDGTYPCQVDGRSLTAEVRDGRIRLDASGAVEITLA